jgi:flagellar biosynthetic protein FliQ
MFTTQSVLTLVQQALMVTMMISGPMLLASLVTGLLVSIFQAATQIHEATMSFIPKLLAIFAVMIVGGPWMMTVLLDYMRQLITQIPQIIG